ncbi:MAG: outer membrane protein [Sphingobacteriales bacterium]|jgi:outer membrane protein
MKYLLAVLFLLLFSNHLFSQDSYEMSLQECIDYAFENSPSIKNSKLNVDLATAQVKETTGVGLPQVALEANFNDFLEIPTTFLPGEFSGQPKGTFTPVKFGQQYSTSVGVNVNQLLFDASYILSIKGSKVFKELAIIRNEQSEQELITNVSKAYYSALLTTENLVLLTANKLRLEKILNDTKAYYDNGFVEKLDVDRLQFEFNKVLVEEKRLVGFAALGYSLLKFQMGMPIEAKLRLTESLTEIKAEKLFESEETHSNIQLKLLDQQIVFQSLQVKNAKYAFLPSLSTFLNTNLNSASDAFDRPTFQENSYTSTLIGLGFRWNLFNGGSKFARISKSKIELDQLNNSKDLLELRIQIQIEQARINYSSNIELLQLQKKNIELAKEIFRVEEIKYNEGLGSNTDLIIAETNLKESSLNYTQAYFDALIAKLELENALGTLSNQ